MKTAVIYSTCSLGGSLAMSHIPDNNSIPFDFDNIYEQHYNSIFRNITYLTGDAHAAEDIAQETFIKLYKSPPKHSNIFAWLQTVATNLSYNYLRNNKLRRSRNEEIFMEEGSEVSSIEDEALRDFEQKTIKEVLELLKPRDRMCLLLKFSGYKYAEIAEALNIDKNSVGTIIARAQAKFKEQYLKRQGGNSV